MDGHCKIVEKVLTLKNCYNLITKNNNKSTHIFIANVVVLKPCFTEVFKYKKN
ncbi:hypothetical protein VCHA29O37_350012 [Vibrio chagasii]|nr:hypothetical protein VCHA29O37_350012 [Vibrio chagasii]